MGMGIGLPTCIRGHVCMHHGVLGWRAIESICQYENKIEHHSDIPFSMIIYAL